MPKVRTKSGKVKKYPYTKAGKKMAAKARKKYSKKKKWKKRKWWYSLCLEKDRKQ